MSRLTINKISEPKSLYHKDRYQIIKLNSDGSKNSMLTNLILGDLIDLNNELSKEFLSDVDQIPIGIDTDNKRIILTLHITPNHSTFSLVNPIASSTGDWKIEILENLTSDDLIELSVSIRSILECKNII